MNRPVPTAGGPIFVCEWQEVRSYSERAAIAKARARPSKRLPPTLGARSWAIYSSWEHAEARKALLVAARGPDGIVVTIRQEYPPGPLPEQLGLADDWPIQRQPVC